MDKKSEPVVKQCSTDEFWDAMCSFCFVRADLYTGFNGRTNTKYITEVPPEQVDGFLEKKAQETLRTLSPE